MNIGKPIDLIVANSMHSCAAQLELIKSLIKSFRIAESEMKPAISENVARHILSKIAHDGTARDVYAALKAVGAPSSTEDIQEGLTAVLDRAR